ncbi:sensor histidine kinase [Actinomadura sp. 3N407]|uniref:sensor histidine kinase n=1 Tax=Actinomadura sp. 3N407 TaxID=3457423 RepID=UPI003FCC4E40
MSSRPDLQLVFMLGGSAIALAFLTVELMVAGVVRQWDVAPVLQAFLTAVVYLAPPTVVGLIAQMGEIEAVATRVLLRNDIEAAAGAGWARRVRACAWFWCHFISGTAVVVGGVASAMCGSAFLGAPWRSVGTELLGVSWLQVRGDWRDILFVLAAVVVLVTYLIALALCGQALVAIAPVLLGASHEERLAALERRTTELVERNRLAREIHDSVGHALSVVVLQAAAAHRRVRTDPDAVEQGLGAVEEAAKRALTDLDSVLGMLRGRNEVTRSHTAADLTALNDLLVAAERGSSAAITVAGLDVDAGRLPAIVSREAYRIVQESLTNAIRHASGSEIEVALTQSDRELQITVRNGTRVGRRWRRGAGRDGHGIVGMRERVRLLGGRMSAGEVPEGWEVQVSLPLTTKGVVR